VASTVLLFGSAPFETSTRFGKYRSRHTRLKKKMLDLPCAEAARKVKSRSTAHGLRPLSGFRAAAPPGPAFRGKYCSLHHRSSRADEGPGPLARGRGPAARPRRR
jgi:hypothetical protein